MEDEWLRKRRIEFNKELDESIKEIFKNPKKEICKHCDAFDFAQMNMDEHRFDIDKKGSPHSFRGYWTIHRMPICSKFSTEEEQWKRTEGFLYCDLTKRHECIFFELEEDQSNKKNDD